MSDFIVLIPSRMESTRLPGKPLKQIGNKTLIQRVSEQASKSNAKRVLVATDSEEIISHCFEHNIETVVTKSDHQTGSDRLAEAVEILGLEDTQVIINVQGDEPFINPADINNLYHLTVNKHSNMATLFTDLKFEDINNQNVVKLWIKDDGRVINFSRKINKKEDVDQAKMHLGIYAYRVSLLKQFVKWPQSTKELNEQLEQMRVMDNQEAIFAKKSITDIHLGVDTEEDLETAREIANSF
tara:strand:+ start:96 stop:818 length:723 start_codon:yes stop_codon:yes gene_type:complete